MATDKDVEAKKDPETRKDVDTKKEPGTGEPSIEYLVDGLTEDELKRVSGGVVTKLPMRCSGVMCAGLGLCAAHCASMNCPSVVCGSLSCKDYAMPD